MKVREIQAKSIITKSNLPESEFVVNPYVGCTHGCIYCFARFMKRFTNHPEAWGDFVDVKINAAELIPDAGNKYKDKSILISSVTDPYQPLENRYKLMPGILQKLLHINPRLGILTKSDLIVRDIDLLKKFRDCAVGFTITSLNDDVGSQIEPGACRIQKRIDALRLLKNNGVKTYVFIGPIIPFITNWKEIVVETKSLVDDFMFDKLNISGIILPLIKKWIQGKHPSLIEKYEKIYSGTNTIWPDMENEIRSYCESNKINHRIYFRH